MLRRPSLPAGFPELLTKTFEAAVKSGDLIYTDSTSENVQDEEVNIRYTFAPSLAKKPTGKENADEDTEATSKADKSDSAPELAASPCAAKFNPFEKPDPKLMLVADYGDYSLVLNKFAIVPNHFLQITKKVVPQTAPLTPTDLEYSFAALQAAESDGSRYIGFFNCGPNSGASVDHKHIQFLKLADDFKPFPDQVIKSKAGKSYKEGQAPLTSPKVPFAHFIVPLEVDWEGEEPVAEELGFKFSTVLSRVLTELRVNDASSISYNVVFSEKWLMAVPRSKDSYKGLGVNATGTIGLLLAKSKEELELYKEETPLKVLTEVGFVKPVDAEHPDYDY